MASATPQPGRSVSAVHPELIAEWDFERNAPLTPENTCAGSEKKVWWRCKKGHEWLAAVYSRANGNGCPYCANHSVLKVCNDLATIIPKLSL